MAWTGRLRERAMLILASPSEAAFLHGRLVLVIDDLHHADQPSLLLLRFLAVAGRPTAAVTPPTETATADACIFRREGDFWTIAYEGQLIRLRDTRGLRYLALLLAQPGREFHAADLVTAETASTAPPGHDGEMVVASGLGDAGALLDARARADYRRRLADLREELEEAERMHDLGRGARARAELEVLAAQLASAARGSEPRRTPSGPGSRSRRASSPRSRRSPRATRPSGGTWPRRSGVGTSAYTSRTRAVRSPGSSEPAGHMCAHGFHVPPRWRTSIRRCPSSPTVGGAPGRG